MIIQGIDSSSVARPLLVDASGRAIISADSLTSTGGKLQLDASGNLKTVVQENLFSVPDSIIAQGINSNLPAGISAVTVYTVVAGEVVRLMVFTVQYIGTVAGVLLNPRIVRGGTVYVLPGFSGIVSGAVYGVLPQILLEGGDVVACNVLGATLNDDFIGNVFLDRIK